MAQFNRLGAPAAALYRELERHPSLVLLTPLNEASGNVSDRSLTTRATGSANGSPTYGADLGNGFTGVDLDGVSYFSLGDVSALSFDRTSPFTLLALAATSRTAGGGILGKYNTAGNVGWLWEFDVNGAVWLYVIDSGGGTQARRTDVGVTADTPALLAVTRDATGAGAGITHYHNGVVRASTIAADTLAASSLTSSPAAIGSRGGANVRLDGQLAFVAAFNAVLSAEELRRFAYLARFL